MAGEQNVLRAGRGRGYISSYILRGFCSAVSRLEAIASTVAADEALELGFLNRATTAAEAEAAALDLAGQLAANDPEGVRRLKGMFRDFAGLPTAERVARENEILVEWQTHGAGLPSGGVPQGGG